MFLKLGFKSITMDDIANEMCISKKTIYKFFANKELLIAEATEIINRQVYEAIERTLQSDYNAVEENFEIRKIFKGLFRQAETSPFYQLKKHYPEIYDEVMTREKDACFRYMRHNIIRGMETEYYRSDTDVENSMEFYYTVIFHINTTTMYEKVAYAKELAALIYHTRAIATPKGLAELDRQLMLHT